MLTTVPYRIDITLAVARPGTKHFSIYTKYSENAGLLPSSQILFENILWYVKENIHVGIIIHKLAGKIV